MHIKDYLESLRVPSSMPGLNLKYLVYGVVSAFTIMPLISLSSMIIMSAFIGLDLWDFNFNSILFLIVFGAISFKAYKEGRRIENIHFRKKNIKYIIFFSLFVIFAAGLLGNEWCYQNHICRDGHMRHEPYPDWHYYFDALWAAALLLPSWVSLVLRLSISPVLTFLSFMLVTFRFYLGSMGGFF